MSKKVTISSSKTFASNKALINTRSKLPINPIPMRAYPIGTKVNENAKDTDKSTSIENNGKIILLFDMVLLTIMKSTL